MKKLPFDKLLIATGNRHKYAEIQGEIQKKFDINVVPAFDYDIDEPEETGKTFAENALIKAKYYSEQLGIPALADDSGLCVNALNGDPGIYSARWAEEHGGHDQAIKKIQNLLEYKKTNDYTSYFICNMALYIAPNNLHEKNHYIFEGRVEGILKFPPQGYNGFGYDPIFVPKGYNRTFGELDKAIKRKISHRAVSLRKVLEFLSKIS